MSKTILLTVAILAAATVGRFPRAKGEVQEDSTWGLARVSLSRNDYQSNGPYNYYYDGPEETAKYAVTAYIIDTGITPEHADFGGRAVIGANFVNGETACDQNGHGTHVAGTIGGTKYGACKTCRLVGVKVLSGFGMGSNQGVVNGIKWAADNCTDPGGCVVNMSLGGGKNAAVDEAVTYAYNKGVPVVVAAGNSKEDACKVSPAGAEHSFTVAASNVTNGFAGFSNHGSCTEMIAPGVAVTSAWINQFSGVSAFRCQFGGTERNTRTISGTSMASPHVAGVAAYLRSIGVGRESPDALYAALVQYSQKGLIETDTRGTPNRLVYNNYMESDNQRRRFGLIDPNSE